ncbi:MAG: protein kinase, partial [Bacteroidia bacterium]|nr:protein kinase [Bacteroidia bacterium]
MERRAALFLAKNLPQCYKIICNYIFLYQDVELDIVKDREVDIIVIAPHAIYVIDVKGYDENLKGDDQAWFYYGKRRENPIRKIRYNAKRIHGNLEKRYYLWGKIWVEGIIVLANEKATTKNLEGDHKYFIFLLDENLINYIKDPSEVRANPDQWKSEIDKLAQYFAPEDVYFKKAASNGILYFKDVPYQIIGTINRKPNEVTYEVQPVHDTGQNNAFITVYNIYPTEENSLTQEQIEEYKQKIFNAKNILDKLKHPYILPLEYDYKSKKHKLYELNNYGIYPSLEQQLTQNTQDYYSYQDKLRWLEEIATALQEAHCHGIIHRSVAPENIIYDERGGICLLHNFKQAFFPRRKYLRYTVFEKPNPYTAPELLEVDRDTYGSFQSDIYSLGLVAYWIFIGKLPFEDPNLFWQVHQSLPKDLLPSALDSRLAFLDELIQKTVCYLPEERVKDMSAFLELLKGAKQQLEKQNQKLFELPYTLIITTTSSQEEINAINQQDNTRFEFLEILGSGGSAKVYLVESTFEEKKYVLKLFAPQVSQEIIKNEMKNLQALEHPNIVRYNRASPIQIKGELYYYILTEYLPGAITLDKWVKEETNRQIVYQWSFIRNFFEQLCDALAYIHQKEIWHCDIKPSNILYLPEESRFVLIDFNISQNPQTKYAHNSYTLGYVPKDLISKDASSIQWDASADTFALGITFYELLCGQYPWNNRQQTEQKPVSIGERLGKNLLSLPFIEFLDKSISLGRGNRFADGKEMLAAFKQIKNLRENPQVENLLKIYQRSQQGNSDNRGLKTQFAYDTYIETLLDKELIDAIWQKQFTLVLLIGNPGDGKTAILKKIKYFIEKQTGETINEIKNGPTPSGWEY